MKTALRGASFALAFVLASALYGCRSQESRVNPFDEDLRFLLDHAEVIVLGEDPAGARVAVVPQWQGRVVTSTTGGKDGISHGWINRELIAKGEIQPHINVFGGEDRFWMGPEGGQYAIFFRQGDPFDLEHWQTPAAIDTDPYAVVSQDARAVSFRHEVRLQNYSGTWFDVGIERTIRLLDAAQAAESLGVAAPPGVRAVAYESENRISNQGEQAWTRQGGLLSIWILGMFRHSDFSTVIVPFRQGPEQELGPIVNDSYFGKVPAERLAVGEGVLFFKADGRCRSKIGVSPARAKDVLGSYDPSRQLLTIVRYDLPEGARDYVNSMWALQEQPYGGDAINSYNDGPPAPGKPPLGPFYELETSSPAAVLGPGESMTHTNRTFHFRGDQQALDLIATKVLGVSLAEVGMPGSPPPDPGM